MGWDSSVGTATGNWLDGRGSIPGKGKKLFCTPQPLDRPLAKKDNVILFRSSWFLVWFILQP
jgi:hypothetical protein